MIRLFWFSLSLVVMLSGLLILRGGVPAGEGPNAGWRAWLLGEDARRSRNEDRVAALEVGQRHGQEALLARLDAAESELHALRSRVEKLESLPRSVEMRLESGALVVRQDDKGWRIANLFQREREFRERVTFEKGFAAPPRVMLGVVGMEPGQERLHFQLSVEGVDAAGFTLLVMTRAEERPRELRVGWSAFGE
ncbi:hypothetical protein SIID45300_01995 [Candidatus Magnetaquicoccaceae bacterium FCR-1]|uniref:H-type lectin domain-containing protein n=1 Tax=Candidatus Magnetaquiglobus chichijimensis TaxID=3141448 RepID=A0ABQ0C9U5_9PROT